MNFRGVLLLAGFGVGTAGGFGAGQAGTAFVHHSAVIRGAVTGNIQQMEPEDFSLDGDASVSGDLLVPGTPAMRLHGHPSFGGVIEGSGGAKPSNYHITLSGRSTLRHVVRRTDPYPLPPVCRPTQPSGTRAVCLSKSGQNAGDFVTLRDLTISGKAGWVAVPPGSYGDFSVNSGGLVLGVVGSTSFARYDLQRLTLNGDARLQIVGPVELNLGHTLQMNGRAIPSDRADWLRLNVWRGGVTLRGGASLAGHVNALSGNVVVDGRSRLSGSVACDRLTVAGGGQLHLIAANQPPSVAISAPADGASVAAFSALTLKAIASDSDGTISQVEFFSGADSLGFGRTDANHASEYTLALLGGLPTGRYSFSASATDDQGAVAESAAVIVTVTPHPNTPPQVTLTAPSSGSTFVANTTVTLAATADDVDGTIAKVEFFDGTTRLGAGAAAEQPGVYLLAYSFGLPGIHSLVARATDDGGATGESARAVVSVLASLPYRADFEVGEGYELGPLAGQGGWQVSAGGASVTDESSAAGARSIVLSPGAPAAEINQTFAPSAEPKVVFVDLFAQPAADAPVTAASWIEVEGARFALVKKGAAGELQTFDGDGLGGGRWQPTSFTVPLAENGATRDWVRFTARLDFGRHTWDLYADGGLVAWDVRLRDNSATGLTRLGLGGHPTIATRCDNLYAGNENPLFADADQDGMDDTWESANGLDPTVDDRNADPDGDGLTNIEEYLYGTHPRKSDTDDDGLYDGDEVFWGWGPTTPTPDTTPPSAPMGLTASATINAVGLSWQAATDNLRVAGYVVLRNGQPIETAQPVRDTQYVDLNLPDNESFSYQVRAFDFAGNLSAPSERVAVRTAAVDSDGNGLPDYWEQKYFSHGGVDPAADDDGDGITNLEEFRAGTDPRDFYNGVLPTHDVLYGGRPGPNDQLAMIVRKSDGSPWPNAPVDFEITSGRRRIAPAPGGPYSYRVSVRADSGGLAQAFLEPLQP